MKQISPHDDAGNVYVCSSQRKAESESAEKKIKQVETGDNGTDRNKKTTKK
jgi:hypothetical protein